MVINALQKLIIEGNARANALLGLSVVEWSLTRYDEAFKILTDNAKLFRKINSHSLKGFYHNQLAMVLRSVAPSHNRAAYYKRALREYEAAELEFKLARNTLFRADVNNNRGFLLYKLLRFRQAHNYLNEARRLALVVRNKVVVAQIDDTRAQVFIAEAKYTEAEAVARIAAASLRKSGHLGLLIDTLITHGIALARLGKREKAEFNFRESIEIAHQMGVLSKAGIASLALIEEIDHLAPDVLAHAYQQAAEWLSNCQSESLLLKFRNAGTKLALALLREKETDNASSLFNMPIDLDNEVLMYERELIRQALSKVKGGSVVDAAKWLGISYQLLTHRIRKKHSELIKERSPVFSQTKPKDNARQEGSKISRITQLPLHHYLLARVLLPLLLFLRAVGDGEGELDVLVVAVDFQFDPVGFDVFVGLGEFVYFRAVGGVEGNGVEAAVHCAF